MTLSQAELTERLREAAEIVEQAELPENLQPVAYGRSLDVLGVLAAEQSANATTAAGAHVRAPQSPVTGMLGHIADRLGLDPSLVARVYDEDDGQLRLILRRLMLPEPDKKAASMRDVALLVVVGRQAAGIEEHTPHEVIREECRELKIYDRPNFATEVGKLEFRATGGRNTRAARANRHHYEDAAELIRRIAQGGAS